MIVRAVAVGLSLTALGCTTYMRTNGADGVVVNVLQPTTVYIVDVYEQRSASLHDWQKAACKDDRRTEIEMMPGSRRYTVDIITPLMGVGGGSVELNDQGGLKKVAINSDATAPLGAVADVAKALAPFYGLNEALGSLLDPINSLTGSIGKVTDLPGLLDALTAEALAKDGAAGFAEGAGKSVTPQGLADARKRSFEWLMDSQLTFEQLRAKYCHKKLSLRSINGWPQVPAP